MKKLISILTTLTMLFAFAAIPSMAEVKTVEFNTVDNVAFSKTVTTLEGVYAEGNAPSEGVQLATDGDIKTAHTSTSAKASAANTFYVDLGAKYLVDDITIYFSEASVTVNVYAGNKISNENLIGTATSTTEPVIIGDTTVYPATMRANGNPTQYITFSNSIKNVISTIVYHEIYVGKAYIDDSSWNIALNSDSKIMNTFVSPSQYSYHGNYYYSSSGPTKTQQWGIDGKLDDNHRGYGKTGNGYVMFTVDLGAYYKLDRVSVVTDASKNFNVYNSFYEPYYTSTDFTERRSEFFGSNQYKVGVAAGVGISNVAVSTIAEGVNTYYVSTLDMEQEVARYITFEYEGTASCYYREVMVSGTPVSNALDIREKTNIASGLAMEGIKASEWWGSGIPSETNSKSTDGNMSTNQSGYGRYSNGMTFMVDLGQYYKLNELTMYTGAANAIRFYSGEYGVHGSSTSKDPSYLLNNVGAKATPFATAPAGTVGTVNGVNVYTQTVTLEETAEPVRYLIVEQSGWSVNAHELYVTGTPVSALETAETECTYDSASGNVTANVTLVNGSDVAKSGKIYYVAYNSNKELVGATSADADLAATTAEVAGGVYRTPATFAVTEEPATIQAYYWTDKLVPIFDSAIDLK